MNFPELPFPVLYSDLARSEVSLWAESAIHMENRLKIGNNEFLPAAFFFAVPENLGLSPDPGRKTFARSRSDFSLFSCFRDQAARRNFPSRWQEPRHHRGRWVWRAFVHGFSAGRAGAGGWGGEDGRGRRRVEVMALLGRFSQRPIGRNSRSGSVLRFDEKWSWISGIDE